MWIHGGSFRFGSATNPGLDGSKLAIATNSIVAVIQYRLGALGFLSPDGPTNLALKDVITALTFLKKVVPSFGGNPTKITVAGQSSGATMIRALLAVPSASSLFQSAIIQSDPMDFGFLKPSTQQLLQNAFTSSLNCSPTDTASLSKLSINTIINVQENLCGMATNIDPSLGLAIPIRPVNDGTLITSSLDSTSPFPYVSKPLIISTVLDEAGPSIFGSFTAPIPEGEYEALVNATFGPPRTTTILNSGQYKLPPHLDAANFDGRNNLQTIGTDYLWKCSSWSFAREWVQHGGHAYVGRYSIGATYPANDGVPFCTQSGSVCHQDDIEIVFGTVPNPTLAQAALTTQMQKRYKAFLMSGNPNVDGVSSWPAATTSNVQAINLGGTDHVPVGACTPSFWGKAVQFDYQVFGI
jgi:carboxylesterase type B